MFNRSSGGKYYYGGAAVATAVLAYKNESVRDMIQDFTFAQDRIGECASAEEQAAELDKILKESGGMIS